MEHNRVEVNLSPLLEFTLEVGEFVVRLLGWLCDLVVLEERAGIDL